MSSRINRYWIILITHPTSIYINYTYTSNLGLGVFVLNYDTFFILFQYSILNGFSLNLNQSSSQTITKEKAIISKLKFLFFLFKLEEACHDDMS